MLEFFSIVCITKQTPTGRLLCYGAVKGIRTPMVSHTDLNRARLPIPP